MAVIDKSTSGGENPDEVSFEALLAALKSGACALIDVREPNEFEAGHAAGAVNLPLSSFDPEELPRDKPVVLICRSGARSLTALNRAREAGFADIRHFRRGTIGWANAGGEIV